VPWTASSLGFAYALAGRHEEGVANAQEAVKRGEALGITRYQPLRMSLLANAYLLAGRYQDALGAARNSLELTHRYRERGPEAWALYLIAASMAQTQRGERNEIYDNYLAALKSADELGMRPLVAHCHFDLGKLDQQSKQKQAREHFTTATTMYREMDMQFRLEQAEAEIRELA